MLPPGHPLDFFVKQPKTKHTHKSFHYFQQNLYEKFNLLKEKEILYHITYTEVSYIITSVSETHTKKLSKKATKIKSTC